MNKTLTLSLILALGAPAAAGQGVYAQGELFSYNRDSRQFDIRTGRGCSVTLKNFRTYTDTEHGSPQDVVAAEYVLGGFSDLGNYTSGTAAGSAPDAYASYVSLQNYLQSGLTKGVDVKIFIDNVSSAQTLLARPVPPVSVYVTKENSMSSYFGGNGVKWGYWCDLRAPGAKADRGGWDAYDLSDFPNGSAVWSLGECSANHKGKPYLGCYASPELDITRKEPGKPAVKTRGIIVSKILPNDREYDAGGYGYCLGDEHPYRVIHEVRVMEGGRAAAYPYPEFYAGGFRPGEAQNLYEWGGGLWGTANCDRTDKTMRFTGAASYEVSSTAAALDFGNIVFSLNTARLVFEKI